MIKKTSETGNWIVVDSNGINTSANDRSLFMNTSTTETFTDDYIDVNSSGFIIKQTGTIDANASGATYIFLAIA
jgi:hypothetical protein